MRLPQAFIDRTTPLLGDSFPAFVEALESDIPISIRTNPLKTSQVLKLDTIPWCTNGYYLPIRPSFTLDPLLHAGVYYVQEASSMFLEQIVKQHITSSVTMLDLCAAPGGKSTHLVSLLPTDSLLVANEYVRSRAYILAENLQKWGSPNVVVSNNDPKDLGALYSFFDAVLVDAPCSGEGMFRKDAGAIDEWSVANVENCVLRQRSLLSDVWSCLKEDGLLIYSTCTYNREENEDTVKWMLDELGAELLTVQLDEVWGITATDFGYRFYPHKTKGEGFFMAVLRKTEAQQTMRIKPEKQGLKLSKQQLDLKNYLLHPEYYTLSLLREKVVALPNLYSDKIAVLMKKLKLMQAGIPLAEAKGKDMIPEPGLALSIALDKSSCNLAEVDWRTALSYLRTENIVLPDSPKGYVLICYKGHPLGWVKNLGNRCNGLYPSEWRIRMNIPTDAVEQRVL
jgi:16S rRNA C967 or C1407 C5-methylase (RsmB/RsmF family)/NOL1/NOP2/fmu family ribosome biogenesis protein